MNVETFDYTTFSKQEKKAFRRDEQEIMEFSYRYSTVQKKPNKNRG